MSEHAPSLATPLEALAHSLGDRTHEIDDVERPFVVVVDDDPGIRSALRDVLSAEYRVILCASGEEAAHMVDSRASVVILDIRMPSMDGFSTYETIRRKFRHVPIIFYSGYQDARDPYEIMNVYRPFAYVSKGSTLQVLTTALASAIRHHRDVVRYSSVSRELQISTLNRAVELLQCDQAQFCSLVDGQLQQESIVTSSAWSKEHTRQPPLPLRASGSNAIEFFDGKQHHDTSTCVDRRVELHPGAYVIVPVLHQGKQIGALCIRWNHSASVAAQVFADVQTLAAQVAFTEAGTTLQIRALETRVKRSDAKRRRLRAELFALQARVNPRFLYNSLNSIAALVHADPDRAEAVVLRLCEVFRHVLHHSLSEIISLREELRVAKAYLRIEQVRLGERLRVVFNVDRDALEYRVPPLLLFPLVENAIAHGAAASETGATVFVSVKCVGAYLRLRVRDDGPGLRNTQHHGSGRSLDNLRRRLRLHYGKAAQCRAKARPKGGFASTVLLPQGDTRS